MIINRQTIEFETKQFLTTLFSLQEIERIAIKNIPVTSPTDAKSIEAGLTECYHDVLSDVDINLWIRLHPVDFNRPTPVYKSFFSRLQLRDRIFGIVFQERVRSKGNKEGMRIVLKSGFRMDVTCHVHCDEAASPLPERDLYRNDMTGSQERKSAESVHTNELFWPEVVNLDKANQFWFCAIQALAKLLRRDYLIADHLSHILLMEGLVLQMMQRDNTYHTNFHRYGYGETLAYQEVDVTGYETYMILLTPDQTYRRIAENLIRAVISYDNLALEENSLYEGRRELFFAIWDCYIKELSCN